MKQGESKLSRSIINALNARGHFVWKNNGSIFSRRGVSDITGVNREGFAIAIETKMPSRGKNLSDAQRSFLCRMRRSSALSCVGVATSVKQAIEIVEGNEFQEWWAQKNPPVAQRTQTGGSAVRRGRAAAKSNQTISDFSPSSI